MCNPSRTFCYKSRSFGTGFIFGKHQMTDVQSLRKLFMCLNRCYSYVLRLPTPHSLWRVGIAFNGVLFSGEPSWKRVLMVYNQRCDAGNKAAGRKHINQHQIMTETETTTFPVFVATIVSHSAGSVGPSVRKVTENSVKFDCSPNAVQGGVVHGGE